MTIYKIYKHGASLNSLIKEYGIKKVIGSLKYHGIKCKNNKGKIIFFDNPKS